MIQLLNTLYVLTDGAYLHLESDTVRVVIEGETKLRVPLVRLGSIVVFGAVSVSPFLIHRCADDGRSIVWMTRNGRFKARVEGSTRGNVLLRRAQQMALDVPGWPARIARSMVAAKVQNSRMVLLRAAREADGQASDELGTAAKRLADILTRLGNLDAIDLIRGAEGEAARTYFGVFGWLVRTENAAFVLDTRSRRPPRDRVNALLSFLYALVRQECVSALEGVGLDPQVGYLHALRPGRPALALDLMEELRPLVADRLALTLINRRQLSATHFEETLGGAVRLTDEGRRTVLSAYQERKKKELSHRLLQQKLPLGMVPHVQARLLARHLRGDIADYPAYLAR